MLSYWEDNTVIRQTLALTLCSFGVTCCMRIYLYELTRTGQGLDLEQDMKKQAFLSSPGEITVDLGHRHPSAFL